jgi:aminoglycoside phosphotransferase (APT) family kinase protein
MKEWNFSSIWRRKLYETGIKNKDAESLTQPDENNTHQIAGKLIAYLRSVYNDSSLAYDLPLTQLTGGIETATYQFKLKSGQKELNQPLVLRLYPEYRRSEDAVWESSVQNALAKKEYPAAMAYKVCVDKSILGGAFYIMQFLPGQPLWTAPFDTIAEMLGQTHANLHQIDPQPLVKMLQEQGFDENRFQFRTDFFNSLAIAAKGTEFPWTRAMLNWLIQNHPPKPDRLAICHGDFHPLNILIKEGKVTGVLDWHLSIADPILDVANTIRLITMIKHLSVPEAESIDWETFIQKYLAAYRTQLPLDLRHIDYYRVVQDLVFLYDSVNTQALRVLSLINESLEFIHKVTGIQVKLPE